MTTKEMEQMLGVTKATLIYYEKEGFIKPKRGDNNYRNYSQKDVEIIKFIMMMRSMQLSIDDIQLIFNGELSIRDALETKQEYLKKEHLEIEEAKQKIKDYIKRYQVIIELYESKHNNKQELIFKELSQIQYPVLNINEQEICFGETMIKIADIKKVKLSMCSQLYLSSIIKLYMNYYVDIDFVTDLDTYSFQIMNNDQVNVLFDILKNLNIEIVDPLDVMGLYARYSEQKTRQQFLDAHFKSWAKEYHLDNPRDTMHVIAHQYTKQETQVEKAQVVQQNFKKDWQFIKNIFKK